jgi:UDP-N-acetylmuramate dehydrogenase
MIEYLMVNKISYEENVSLKKLNTYKIGGTAKLIVYPSNNKELINILKIIKKENLKYKIIGNGSNLIFKDIYYDMVLINFKKLNSVKMFKNKVKVGAGVNLSVLANDLGHLGFTGFEFCAGIPGNVGGAVYMNAGAYNMCMADILLEIEYLDGNLNIVKTNEFNYSYRHSDLMGTQNICLSATFKLEKGVTSHILSLMKDRRMRRLSSQPLSYPSAGSVFRNPSKEVFAGKLIEDLGLKGVQKGGAEISELHANFVINKNKATSDDIINLIMETKAKVKEKYDIDLILEQEIVGD